MELHCRRLALEVLAPMASRWWGWVKRELRCGLPVIGTVLIGLSPGTAPAFPCLDPVDTDGDGIGDACDPCKFFDNSGPGGLDDFNGDGIPDVCQCGDANANNSVDGNDLTTIFGCLSGAIPAATCTDVILGSGKGEANGNLTLDGNDLTQIFQALSGLQPNSALTCANRTEGTLVP